MSLKLLLAVSLLALTGCVTKKKVVEIQSQYFMMGWIHGQEQCSKDIVEYNKWLFGDRVDKAKEKKLNQILKGPGERVK